MIPELFKIGPVTINSFGVMAMLAFLIPTLLLRKEVGRKGLDPDLANGIAIAAMIGGFLGARIYYILERWNGFLEHPVDYIFTGAGLVWYGGLVGGILAVAWYVKHNQISLQLITDLIAPLVALGQVFGRCGCLLSGDGDYGYPTDMPWAMTFPNGIIPTNEFVHPTPIYDMIILFSIFLILWRVRLRDFPPGMMFGLYLVMLGIGRFATEFFRTTTVLFVGLTAAQLISVVFILIGIFMVFKARSGARINPKSQ